MSIFIAIGSVKISLYDLYSTSTVIPSVFAQEPTGESVEAYFTENKDTIAGSAVIWIKSGGIIGEYYYGFADIENGLAVDESTVFEWGSVTKLLTWT